MNSAYPQSIFGEQGKAEITLKQKRKQLGALTQVNLFLAIWIGLMLVFFMLLIGLGRLNALFASVFTTTPDGFSMVISQENLESLMTALMLGGPAMIWLIGAQSLAVVGAVLVMQRFAAGPALLDLGLRPQPGWLKQMTLGLLIGVIVFLCILVLELGAGWAQVGWGTIGAMEIAAALVTLILVAVGEEILARGFILQVLERDYGATIAALGSSVIFALLHAFNPGMDWFAFGNITLVGIVLAYCYLTTRQLWLPIAFHLSWNFAQGPLLGFPVSGITGKGLLDTTVLRESLVTGGAFGPEGGVVGLLGIGLSAVMIYIAHIRTRRTNDAQISNASVRWTKGTCNSDPSWMGTRTITRKGE